MKKYFASIFLFFLAFMSLQQFSVVALYLASQDFVTEKFCVNKEKPELQCNGKCHMQDVIAQNAEKENSDTGLNVEVIIPVYYSEVLVEIPPPSINELPSRTYSFALEGSYEYAMFQPPEA